MDVIDVEIPEGTALFFGARGFIEVRSLEREKGWVELVIKSGETDEVKGAYRVHLVVEEFGEGGMSDIARIRPVVRELDSRLEVAEAEVERLRQQNAELKQWRSTYGESALRDAQRILAERKAALDELERLRAQNAELLLLLGLIEMARDFGHVHELLAEFRKAPDFPVPASAAETQTPAAGAAGGDR
jgi:hypothetical protein